jgi:hypothetical protein
VNTGYNLAETKKAFDPITADRYNLKVESAEVSPHTKDGVDGHKIEVIFRVVGGEFEKRKVWDYIYLPWTAWKARTILEAAGSKLADSDNITADGIAAALLGGEVTAWIESTKTDDDKVRTNVKEYKPVVSTATASFLR